MTAHGADFVSMAGPEADIRDIIERHLDVVAECTCGTAQSSVDGVETCAVEIVKMLRAQGIVL